MQQDLFYRGVFSDKMDVWRSNAALEYLSSSKRFYLKGIVFLTPWIKCKGWFETWAWTMSRYTHVNTIVCYFFINTQISRYVPFVSSQGGKL
jgi:hypothetical protein